MNATTATHPTPAPVPTDRAVFTPPELPALMVGTVGHTRHHPLKYSFNQRHAQWLVDLDDLPSGPAARWVAKFDASDHLDGGQTHDQYGSGIRGDLVRYLAVRDIEVTSDDRLLMLAHPRQFGHTFNPLSIFWVLAPDDTARAVLFEVHNTYSGRHVYLIDSDALGRAEIDKDFYVSPFNDLSGSYAVKVALGPEKFRASIGLDRDGTRVFDAWVRGTPRPASRWQVARVLLTHPFMTWQVSALIRFHGIRLWLARLPIVPRPSTPERRVR